MLISSLSERISKIGVSHWGQTKYTQDCGRTSILWTLSPDTQARDAVPSAYITSVGDVTNPHTLEECVRGDHDHDSLPGLVSEAKSTGVRRVTFEVPYYYQPKFNMKVRQQVELNLTRSGGWTMAAVGYGENNTQVFGSYANTDRMGVYKDLVDEFSFMAEVKLENLHFKETTLPCNGELKHPKSPVLEGTFRASPKAWNSWQVIHLGYCPLCVAEVKSDPKSRDLSDAKGGEDDDDDLPPQWEDESGLGSHVWEGVQHWVWIRAERHWAEVDIGEYAGAVITTKGRRLTTPQKGSYIASVGKATPAKPGSFAGQIARSF